MGIELELLVLFLMQTVGMSVFMAFEVETPALRLILRWLLLLGLTLGLYAWVGHWSLLVPVLGGGAGVRAHLWWCREHGIHPVRATPRRRLYELRGWSWPPA